MNASCQQKPEIGGSSTIKLDFDLFPPTSTLSASATSPSPAVITVTSAPTKASVPASSSESPTAMSQRTNDRQIGLGIGLGAGFGCLAIASAIVGRTLYKRSIDRKQKALEADVSKLHADHTQADITKTNPNTHRGISEAPAIQRVEIGQMQRVVPELSVPGSVAELNSDIVEGRA